MEETPQPIKITSFPPSGFSTSRVEPSYKDIKISSVYGKAKATFAEDEKQTIDERIKSKLTHLPHMYSKNKLMIKKRHKLRETIGTFDFKNRRKSDLDIYDKYNSLERNLRTPIMSLHDEGNSNLFGLY